MPEVSFYILPSQSEQQRWLFACKLLEKAYRSGHRCYVLTDTPDQSQTLDDLLWTFRAGSFIPHQIYMGDSPDPANLILVGSMQAPNGWHETQVNLSAHCPEHFGQCRKIAEILDDSEEVKALGRQRYRLYTQSGIDVVTHKL